ncbi:MAG: repeat-containing protein [Bacillales bacterium]|jgi:tetratricopeptide (TPR) repeat protein|nr:repeat-containing protein [Bacillales bacterium]
MENIKENNPTTSTENTKVEKANDKQNKPNRKTHPNMFYPVWLAAFLIILTAAVSAGGWYYFGEKYIAGKAEEIRLEEQLDFYKQKAKAQPKDANVLVDLGFTYLKLGDVDSAINNYKRALKIDKNNFNIYLNLGIAYMDAKKYDDAAEALLKATKISPQDYQGFMYLGMAYKEMKMYDKALEQLGKANDIQPGSSTIIYNLGQIAEAREDYQGAADVYKEALMYDPLFKDAIEALERVEKKLK